jgi:cytochrome oxidase assembly protein ShyY1
MRRVPIVATLVVLAAVATMIWLGVWQLHRAAWKESLLTQYKAAASLPPVDLDPLLDGHAPLPPLAFRRALVTCGAIDALAEVRVGRNLHDEVGQAYVVPCRPGAAGLAGRIRINVGWSASPDAPIRQSLHGLVAGRLGAVDESGPITLTAATAVPPLVPSQPLSIEAIPNNHLAYAFQWFAFAAIGLVIYVLALRRRNRDALPPEP